MFCQGACALGFFDMEIKERLKLALSGRQKHSIVEAGRVPSAVLVPIYRKQGQYYVLFIRRTRSVKYHKGEISFPGGGYQEGDKTLADTALRESYEEVGLKTEDVEMLGELDDIATLNSNFIVSPFVAFITPAYELRLNPAEAEELIEVPIPALLGKGRDEPGTAAGERSDYLFNYQGKIIKGATARILKQFLEIFAGVAGSH